MPFLRSFPETSRRFIFVAPGSSERMAALRQAVAHLQAGGALMLFPHGDVEPDPASMPGAHKALGDWSPSVEILLRKAPQAVLQVVIASGVLLPRFAGSPVVRIRRKPEHRQKLAECYPGDPAAALPAQPGKPGQPFFGRPLRAQELPRAG